MSKYNCYLGMFDNEWKNPPSPFNPSFRPDWKERNDRVNAMVEKGEPYASRNDRKLAREAAYLELDTND